MTTTPPRPRTTRDRAGRRPGRIGLLVAAVAIAATSCWQPFDFDDDHLADFIVLSQDPPTPTTPMLLSYRDLATGHVLASVEPFHMSPAPEDYDGNGTFDPAFVDTTTAVWTTNSPAGSITFPVGGAPACTPAFGRLRPVPADYDGDRAADPAWYCGSTGTWYIEGREPFDFGRPATADPEVGEDIAVPADYDGDLKTDPAVFNLHTLEWRVRESSTGQETTVTMTGNESFPLPVPGDYLGTGRAQRATVGPDGWIVDGIDEPIEYIAPMNGSEPSDEFEFDHDFPAPADYDGDNIVDLGVWHGDWHVLHSKDVEPEDGDGESAPWNERSPFDSYEERRDVGPWFTGLTNVAPAESWHLVTNISLVSFWGGCNVNPVSC